MKLRDMTLFPNVQFFYFPIKNALSYIKINQFLNFIIVHAKYISVDLKSSMSKSF